MADLDPLERRGEPQATQTTITGIAADANELRVDWETQTSEPLEPVEGEVSVLPEATGRSDVIRRHSFFEQTGGLDTFSHTFNFDLDSDVDVLVTALTTFPDNSQDQRNTTIPAPDNGGLGPIITVTNCSVSPRTVLPSESVELGYTLRNGGDQAGDRTVEFTLNGVVVASATETNIFPDESRSGSVTFTPENEGIGPGFYEVGIVGNAVIDCEGLTVEDPGGDEANVSVLGINVLDSSPVAPGDTIEIMVSFQNTGTATGTISRTVEVNDIPAGTVSATVEPGSNPTDSVFYNVPDVNSLVISVVGFQDTITLQVEDPSASIRVRNCGTNPQSGSTVGVTQTVQIAATLENNGDADGQVTVTFFVSDQPIGSVNATVPAGATTQVSDQFTPSDLGLSGTFSTAIGTAQEALLTP